MVFHQIERVLGGGVNPKNLLKDKTMSHFMEEGFSESEAEQLSWLQNRHTRGAWYGLGGGLVFLYFVNPFYTKFAQTIPQLKYQPNLGIIIKASVLGLFIFGGEYMSNSKRQSANFWITNYFSNNNFTRSKEAFLQNFQVLNRQFSPQENEQFKANEVREREGQRRWIYNPSLHTNLTEEEFRNNMDLYFKKKIHPADRVDVKQTINEQNKEKIDQGQEIKLKAYKITDDVDSSGIKHGIAVNPLNKLGMFQPIL